ncbi:hypothetical protein Y5A_016540 [Burkholderia glumae AU6208]|nr:hypothetical protein Y5A_016540 [Burkholderia glumae AU6208]
MKPKRMKRIRMDRPPRAEFGSSVRARRGRAAGPAAGGLPVPGRAQPAAGPPPSPAGPRRR